MALVLPFPVHIALTLLLSAVAPSLPWLVVVFAVSSLVASVSAGFFFLSQLFATQKVIAGMLYYPIMAFAVSYCSMYLFGRMFGSAM
jgi:hypothetical protein